MEKLNKVQCPFCKKWVSTFVDRHHYRRMYPHKRTVFTREGASVSVYWCVPLMYGNIIVKCPKCQGRDTVKCQHCSATGIVREAYPVTVNIEPFLGKPSRWWYIRWWHGPGHQSTSDIWVHAYAEEVEELYQEASAWQDDPVMRICEPRRLTKKVHVQKIKSALAQIKAAEQQLRLLRA